MFENALYALVRSTLLDGLTGVQVKTAYQPTTVAISSGPTILLQTVTSTRYGALRRYDDPAAGTGDLPHLETQWWETVSQVGCTARRDPQDPAFLTLPSAMDICKQASDILQGDKGLSLLAVQRVRPLRITTIRQVRFVNDSDQYEAMPSFDVTLVHPQVTTSTTPPAISLEPVFGRV